MEVRATAQGYYDLKIRNEGDVFEISSEKAFSDIWMEKVGFEKPAKPVKQKPSPKELSDAAMEKLLDSKDDVI